jgi:hypothetical protein
MGTGAHNQIIRLSRGQNILISVSTSSNSRSMAARSSYETGVSSRAADMAAVVKANLWGIRVGEGEGELFLRSGKGSRRSADTKDYSRRTGGNWRCE